MSDTIKRVFVPPVGYQAKLKALWQYNDLPKDPQSETPNNWATLKVLEVLKDFNGRPATLRVVEVQNSVTPKPHDWTGVIPLALIDKPLGWDSTYEICAKDGQQAERVVSMWFPQGIQVWASHDLGNPGRMAFTPGRPEDDTKRPHWSMFAVEFVESQDCAKVFTVCYEDVNNTWHQELPPQIRSQGIEAYKCAEKKAIEALRKSGWTCKYDRRNNVWDVWKVITIHKAKEN